jgi:RNA polymerase sigma-70 factor (ECF subfamily)
MPQTTHQLEAPRTVASNDATDLFKDHSTAVFRYCVRRLGSREEAEDAVQLTFLNAWRSLERGFVPNQPRPWLFQIAANVCSSFLRSRLGGAKTELRDPVVLDDMAASERNGREELVGLPEALRQLPMQQQRALLLRDWQGLSYREIAADLAVSVASVETLLFRGRNKVAATLTTTNWRKITPSMRAIFIWPFAFMRSKSLPVAGGEHLKLAVGLAAGTVAPLVAFGVVQGVLWSGQAPSHAAQARPSGGVAAAHATGGFLDDAAPLPRAVAAIDKPTTDGSPRQRHDKGTNQPEQTNGAGPANGGGHSNGAGGGSEAPQPSQPPEPSQPPTVADPAPKVIACVATGSKKKPGVTVTISADGLPGHPAPGACS